MNKFTSTKDFQNKMTEKYKTVSDSEDRDRYFTELEKVDSIDKSLEDFMEMFRENYIGEDTTKPEVFVHRLMNEHRTHQQSIVKNLYSALQLYAEKCTENRWFDARNQSAVKWAKEATDLEAYFPCI